MTTHRTQWTPHGAVFPRWADFTYESAAEHWADILRGNGHQYVSTHEIGEAL